MLSLKHNATDQRTFSVSLVLSRLMDHFYIKFNERPPLFVPKKKRKRSRIKNSNPQTKKISSDSIIGLPI